MGLLQSYRIRNNHSNSIHAVSRVSVTSTVLCVVIWLLDIIILALAYSEFCKETQKLEINVVVQNQRLPRPYSVPSSTISRKCFAKGSIINYTLGLGNTMFDTYYH